MCKISKMLLVSFCICTMSSVIVGYGQTTVEQKSEEGVYTNSIGMKFVKIPAGEFTMGTAYDDPNHTRKREFFSDSFTEYTPETFVKESKQHRAVITKPFSIGTTEVTQGQWFEIMQTEVTDYEPTSKNGLPVTVVMSMRSPIPGMPDIESSNEEIVIKKGKNYPMFLVSWEHANEFCKKLSLKENKHYRLPTEAEWEYACRADTTTSYYWGDEWNEGYAWCGENSKNEMHPVARLKPNNWGLYDMNGNVWEWCSDNFNLEYLPEKEEVDPKGPEHGPTKIIRGGSWWEYDKFECRSASRLNAGPKSKWCHVGFRVVLDSEEEKNDNVVKGTKD